MTWTVEFYEEEDGSAPVEKFLAQLPREHRGKALAIVKLLEEAGPILPFPYSSQVRGKIRELRTQHGKDRIRILYFADKQRRFILLHAFLKRAEKLSEHDIATAERRMKKHEQTTGNPAGQKLKARGAKRHPRGIPMWDLLENPQLDISEEKGFVCIVGQFGKLEYEFLHEIEERKGVKVIKATPKFMIIGGQFGEAAFEIWPAEQGLRMKGRIDCGTLAMTFYAEPEGGGTFPGPDVHECERTEDGCIKKLFLEEFLGIEKILRLM